MSTKQKEYKLRFKLRNLVVFGSTVAAATAIPLGLSLSGACGGACGACGACITAIGALPAAAIALALRKSGGPGTDAHKRTGHESR